MRVNDDVYGHEIIQRLFSTSGPTISSNIFRPWLENIKEKSFIDFAVQSDWDILM